MGTIKKWAMMEPIVDHVDSKAINSSTAVIYVDKYFCFANSFIGLGFVQSQN